MSDSDERLTEMPQALRSGLPSDLQNAEIAGTETAGIDESLRLHGPPGTGKSTQSALRISSLMLGEPDLRPSQMTVTTYRRALADTIRKRVVSWGAAEVPDGVDPTDSGDANPFQYWSTIHAAASRATGFHRDIDDEEPLSGMVESFQKRRFCQQLGIDFKPRESWLETRWTVFENLYQYAKDNLLDVGEWKHVDSERLTPLRADHGAESLLDEFREQWGTGTDFETVVEKWESFKRKHDCHDFYEILEDALVGGLPPTRVMVIDEFHDATPLMAAVCDRWIEAAETVIVAGDPDQVVNGYAGASPKFFEDLDSRVEREMPVVRLSRSWRCPDEHFEAAARVLRAEREAPALTTAGPGEMIRHQSENYHFDGNEWSFPDATAPGSAFQLWESYGSDIMFLVRTQKQGDGIAAALDDEGVIYRSQPTVGGSWETRLRLLRVLSVLENAKPDGETNPTNITEFGSENRYQSIENRALTADEAKTLLKHAHGRYIETDEDEWREWLNTRDRQEDDTVPLTELVEHVTEKFWLRYNAGKSSIENLTRLSERDETALRAAWDRYDNVGAIDIDDVETRILTIHASKGAEASDVVVFDGITGSIKKGIKTDEDTRENECRTWYVALTRASERLHILRDCFDRADPYLPADLEPRAEQAVSNNPALTDGGSR